MLKNKKVMSFLCVIAMVLSLFPVQTVFADFNLAFAKSVTANGYSTNGEPWLAVNGNVNDGWYCEGQTSYWMTVDLGQICNINRWIVKHAHTNGDLAVYNTKDFKLQISNDGVNFTDVDTVTGNTADITDRKINAVSGRYVKVYITQGAQNGQANTARIREFEVYGDLDANIALNKTASANGYNVNAEPYRAVNGTLDDGWYCAGQAYYWLMVDLGQTYSINRWVVKHAQSCGDLAVYNTKDFKLQISNDGINFTDVDTVTGNTADITDRKINAASGRYVKVYITQGAQDGQANIARIREFEVYGDIDANIALNKTASANGYNVNGEPYRAVNGTLDDGWYCAGQSYYWLMVDLGQTYSINRWVVKHAQSCGDLAVYNTKDFKLQISNDGINFTDVDTVTGNTADITARKINAASGRYVKVYITQGAQDGQANIARIREFEVYGTGISIPTASPRVISTQFATDDVVVADYVITDSPYNADSTGVKDSTAAIQSAINDCYLSGGGTVWVPAGKYNITSSIYVKPFVTLRGDWRDPDTSGNSYGTVIMANVPSNSNSTPGLFRIGGSAGCMGLTVFYPNQSATNPISYPYTFEIAGRAMGGEQNYMMSSVINCTMLNSYRGICSSITPSDKGDSASSGQVHEMANIVNVKGTVLYRGMEMYNSADVDLYEKINFSNFYWTNAGTDFNSPSRATLDNWTRANATAYIFGDLEWAQIVSIQCEDYHIGINIVPGQRIAFCGEIFGAGIQNCNIAVKVDDLDSRWGMTFTRCTLQGNVGVSPYCISKTTNGGTVFVTDCTLIGANKGTGISVINPGTSQNSYQWKSSLPKPSNANLYIVTKTPYSADKTGMLDASLAIQTALNDAGSNGGGTVYLPAGQYKISTHLSVPANVELKGSSPIPARDNTGSSLGTILCGYEGDSTLNPDTDTALITLNGTNAGVQGLRVWYPNNNPQYAIKAYPYSIRGKGAGVYAINIGFINAYNGIDFKTNLCNNHYIKRAMGCVFKKGIVIGNSDEGWIEGSLANPSACVRTGLSNWSGDSAWTNLINNSRANLEWIIVDNASNEHMLNNFSYGANKFLYVKGNTTLVKMINGGADGMGSSGIGIKVDSGNVNVVGFMKYGGSTSVGAVIMYSLMELW